MIELWKNDRMAEWKNGRMEESEKNCLQTDLICA
jgi:hypothetical protein